MIAVLLLVFPSPKRKESESTTKGKSRKSTPSIAAQAFFSKKDMPVGNDRHLLQQCGRRDKYQHRAVYLD